jgi:hypothetical protein
MVVAIVDDRMQFDEFLAEAKQRYGIVIGDAEGSRLVADKKVDQEVLSENRATSKRGWLGSGWCAALRLLLVCGKPVWIQGRRSMLTDRIIGRVGADILAKRINDARQVDARRRIRRRCSASTSCLLRKSRRSRARSWPTTTSPPVWIS